MEELVGHTFRLERRRHEGCMLQPYIAWHLFKSATGTMTSGQIEENIAARLYNQRRGRAKGLSILPANHPTGGQRQATVEEMEEANAYDAEVCQGDHD